jgi:hypothetical protein
MKSRRWQANSKFVGSNGLTKTFSTQLKRIGEGLGVHLFDQELSKEAKKDD